MKYTQSEIESVTPQAYNLAVMMCRYNGQIGTRAQVFKRLNACGYFMQGEEGRQHAIEFMARYTYERQKQQA